MPSLTTFVIAYQFMAFLSQFRFFVVHLCPLPEPSFYYLQNNCPIRAIIVRWTLKLFYSNFSIEINELNLKCLSWNQHALGMANAALIALNFEEALLKTLICIISAVENYCNSNSNLSHFSLFLCFQITSIFLKFLFISKNLCDLLALSHFGQIMTQLDRQKLICMGSFQPKKIVKSYLNFATDQIHFYYQVANQGH